MNLLVKGLQILQISTKSLEFLNCAVCAIEDNFRVGEPPSASYAGSGIKLKSPPSIML